MSLELAHVHAELDQMAAEEMEVLHGAQEQADEEQADEADDQEPEGVPREEDSEADPEAPEN